MLVNYGQLNQLVRPGRRWVLQISGGALNGIRKNPDHFTCDNDVYEDSIDPFQVIKWLPSKYQITVIYNNFGVLDPIMVRTGLGFSPLLPSRLTVDKDYKSVLGHVFCNDERIVKKL